MGSRGEPVWILDMSVFLSLLFDVLWCGVCVCVCVCMCVCMWCALKPSSIALYLTFETESLPVLRACLFDKNGWLESCVCLLRVEVPGLCCHAWLWTPGNRLVSASLVPELKVYTIPVMIPASLWDSNLLQHWTSIDSAEFLGNFYSTELLQCL